MENKKITCIADLAEYFGIGRIKGIGAQVQEEYMDMICEVIQNKYSHIRKVVFGYNDVVFFDNLGVLTFPFFVYELEDILFKIKKRELQSSLDGCITGEDDPVITIDFDVKRNMFFVANKLRENSFHLWTRAIKEEDSELIDDIMVRSERERKDAMIIFCALMGMEYGDVDESEKA